MRRGISPVLISLASALLAIGCVENASQPIPVADASPGADATGLGEAASADTDSGACTFVAPSYDQSCVSNADCVLVKLGDYCDPTACECAGPLDGINTSSLAQFQADLARTPIGSGAVAASGSCACPSDSDPGACCVAGVCQFSPTTCASDTLAACAEAGGVCSRHVEECGRGGAGPAQSCAQPDETCCLSSSSASDAGATATVDASPAGEAGGCATGLPAPDIQASTYDHSCRVDSDCVSVQLGGSVCGDLCLFHDPCAPGGPQCGRRGALRGGLYGSARSVRLGNGLRLRARVPGVAGAVLRRRPVREGGGVSR